jgi:hypothetical protein
VSLFDEYNRFDTRISLHRRIERVLGQDHQRRTLPTFSCQADPIDATTIDQSKGCLKSELENPIALCLHYLPVKEDVLEPWTFISTISSDSIPAVLARFAL